MILDNEGEILCLTCARLTKRMLTTLSHVLGLVDGISALGVIQDGWW